MPKIIRYNVKNKNTPGVHERYNLNEITLKPPLMEHKINGRVYNYGYN